MMNSRLSVCRWRAFIKNKGISIFFIKAAPVQEYLKILKNSKRYLEDEELNFLDLVELLFSLSKPAKTFEVKSHIKINSFNTVTEASDIINQLKLED